MSGLASEMKAPAGPDAALAPDQPRYPSVVIDSLAGRGDGFREYRLVSFLGIKRLLDETTAASRRSLFSVVAALNGRPLCEFSSLDALWAAGAGRASAPDERVVRRLRDLLLETVDRRLQDEVYRPYLAAHPPPPDWTHERKIAALQATQARARAVVESYDWRWLADWLRLERIGEDAGACLRRLSNLAFPIRRVNLRFTYHCNIACRHCYNSSGPDRKAQRLALQPMLDIVAQMPAVGVGHLNMTGGEPFMYPNDLDALIAAGRAAGLPCISIYSNGFWAIDDDRARRSLARLAAAGFMQGPQDFLRISAGSFHQEFLPLDRVLTAARCYHAMFRKPLKVDFEVAPGDGALARQVRRQIAEAGLAGRIELFVRDHIAPVGRGAQLHGVETGTIDYPCGGIDQITFDPDGLTRPCCGLNNDNHGVVIGRLGSDRLADLVKRMQNDPVLQFLSQNPMSAIFDHLEATPRPGGYAGACELCQHAIGGLTDKASLQAALVERQAFYPFWFTLSGDAGSVRFLAEKIRPGID